MTELRVVSDPFGGGRAMIDMNQGAGRRGKGGGPGGKKTRGTRINMAVVAHQSALWSICAKEALVRHALSVKRAIPSEMLQISFSQRPDLRGEAW